MTDVVQEKVRKKPGPKPKRGNVVPSVPRTDEERQARNTTLDRPSRSRDRDIIKGLDAELEGETEQKKSHVRESLLDVVGGVSASWLARVMGVDVYLVRRKLAGVKPAYIRSGKQYYHVKDVMPYLVKPRVDIGEYIRTLRPTDLPPQLSEAYWSAQIKKQKYEEEAKDLWRTEDVLEVFGELAMAVKTTIQLWVENIDRQHGISAEVRKTLTYQSDELQMEIHRIMVDMPKTKSHTSSVVDRPDSHGGYDDLL